MKALIIMVLLAFAGPHEDNIKRVMDGFAEYQGKEPIMTTLPISCNGANVNTFYAGNDEKQAQIVYGDSMLTIAAARLGGAISGIMSPLNIKGYLCAPYNVSSQGNGVEVEIGDLPRGWVDDGVTNINEAWTSGAPTGNHFGYGRTFRKDSESSNLSYIFNVLIRRDVFGFPTGSTEDFTFRLFYNKEGLTNDVSFTYRMMYKDDGDSETIVGVDSGTFTLESGSGIGVVELHYDSSGADNGETTANKIGFNIRQTSAQQDGTPGNIAVPVGDTFEILGFLWYNSTLSNSEHVLKGSDGLILCPIANSGLDASELVSLTSNASRDALVAELGKILGDGSTDSTEPVSAVHMLTGLNNDTNGITVGMASMESEWRETVIPDYNGAATLPDFNYYPMYGYVDNLSRMTTQAQQLQAFCVGQSHRGFFNLNGYFGGLNPADVSGNDPFGDAFATFTMDAPSNLHTDDASSAAAIWTALLAISHSDNLVEGACTVVARAKKGGGRNGRRRRRG